MLQAPVRLLYTLRPNIPAGVFAATAVSTIVFTATPFLVNGVADEFDIDVETVGIISTFQLAGFMIASWGAGRFFRPRRRMMLIAAIVGIVANLVSGLTPSFSMLLGARFVSGISLGLIAWISWAEVFGDAERVGDVAVIGPIVGTVASPIIAAVIDTSGTDWLFIGFAALYLWPLAFVRSTHLDAAKRPPRQRHRPTRAAAAILVALGLNTFGGSAVFVFAASIGADLVGLSPVLVSLAFSANALASIPSARFRGQRQLPGMWMGITGILAVLLASVTVAPVYWIALPLWGFSFWMAVPGAFSLLAERSHYPDERAGDAQAIMALGRVFGPLYGGLLYSISPTALGVGGGGIILIAAIAMLYIEWRIHPEVIGDLVGTE